MTPSQKLSAALEDLRKKTYWCVGVPPTPKLCENCEHFSPIPKIMPHCRYKLPSTIDGANASDSGCVAWELKTKTGKEFDRIMNNG
jgi:hypothetical protein